MEHLGRLKACCDESLRPVIQGIVKTDHEFAIVYTDRDNKCHRIARQHEQHEFKSLLEACSPAPFGKDHETVLDTDYRDALQMTSDQFYLNFDVAELKILDKIQDLLLPANSGNQIYVKRHKLNVYGPGGHFKEHVDTPRAHNLIGSLVVCIPLIPSGFTGGELQIKLNNDQATVDWSQFSSFASARDIAWAAFFCDSIHEILPVKEGYRITVTYEIFHSSSPEQYGIAEVSTEAFPFYQFLKTAMEDPNFAPNGARFGLFCVHNYPVEEMGNVPPRLKGLDLQNACSLKKLGIEFDLKCVIDLEHQMNMRMAYYLQRNALYKAQYEKKDPRMATAAATAATTTAASSSSGDIWKGSEDRLVYASDMFGVDMSTAYPEFGYEHNDVVRYFEEEALLQRLAGVVWLNNDTRIYLRTPGMQYGNEATILFHYASLAMLFRIPPFNARWQPGN
jgi:hypothetical protein